MYLQRIAQQEEALIALESDLAAASALVADRDATIAHMQDEIGALADRTAAADAAAAAAADSEKRMQQAVAVKTAEFVKVKA